MKIASHLALYIALLVFYSACSSLVKKNTASRNALTNILQTHPDLFGRVLENPEAYRLQILYTQVDRDENNRAHFRSYSYRLNTSDYFYPASSVKLAAAVLALDKLNNLAIPGLNKYTPLRIDSARTGETAVVYDSTAPGGLPTIANYIKKIFLVSDNDAFNRLYEFLGQQYLNETLWAKGYRDVKIIRRLETSLPADENRATNPFTFYHGDTIIYRQPLVINPHRYHIDMRDVQQGKGYYSNGELVNKPIDFSNSNYISIECLQNILKAVMYPEAVPAKMRFNLTGDDYHFLYRYMSMRPRESEFAPLHDSTEYYDSYVKFFMYGDSKENMPDNIRLFSKSGEAYGYLLDNACIVDFKNKTEFLLTAVLQVNKNQIYNDDTYEYEDIGVPFLANLGREVYSYELTRPRKYVPDLSRFEVQY